LSELREILTDKYFGANKFWELIGKAEKLWKEWN
jgi:hypothetical protein